MSEPDVNGNRSGAPEPGDGDGNTAADASTASDALGHFWRAAHELLAAARTVIDAADSLVEEQLQAKPDEPAPRVRRIDVE
jgi:hypothetical protein